MTPDPFRHLSLINPILRALAEEGYHHPTAIQEEAIPRVLAGADLLATAQTGTGKTAAFALPMLQKLHQQAAQAAGAVRGLILTPTRELALQIDGSLRAYGRHLSLRAAVILGGVPVAPQVRALHARPDIVTATPGRLLDLLGQGHLRLDRVEVLVLDEADRMLDMGFVHDVRRIVSLTPTTRQTLLFSATIPADLAEFAADMLREPAAVAVTPSASVSHLIEQKVLFVQQADKRALLTHLLADQGIGRALVFTRTKHGADRVKRHLVSQGISADAIHSNKSQGARQATLAAFDGGRIRVLVATDIVARGIQVEGISHVINYELPHDPESYVHRIGRTARAGASGTALSLCAVEELAMLEGIEKLTRCRLEAMEDHRFRAAGIAGRRQNPPAAPASAARGRGPLAASTGVPSRSGAAPRRGPGNALQSAATAFVGAAPRREAAASGTASAPSLGQTPPAGLAAPLWGRRRSAPGRPRTGRAGR